MKTLKKFYKKWIKGECRHFCRFCLYANVEYDCDIMESDELYNMGYDTTIQYLNGEITKDEFPNELLDNIHFYSGVVRAYKHYTK